MVDTPLITRDSVAHARQALLAQGRKPSQRAVIKLLGGGSFSQVGPLLRELEAEAGEAAGSVLTDPLLAAVTDASEGLWRALGQEADLVVNDARQQFERELKAEQGSRAKAEAATARTQEHLQGAQSSVASLEKALASEQAARQQTIAALEQERLAHTKTETQLDAAQALAAERQRLRDEALAERDALRAELDGVRRESTLAAEQRQHDFQEQRSAYEQQVNALTEEVGQARLRLAEQRSQLDAAQRENTNLTTINSGLSVRIDKMQSVLASTEARLAALDAQRSAEQREMVTLQSTMTERLADKDKVIASLQQQIAERPSDAETSMESGTDGV